MRCKHTNVIFLCLSAGLPSAGAALSAAWIAEPPPPLGRVASSRRDLESDQRRTPDLQALKLGGDLRLDMGVCERRAAHQSRNRERAGIHIRFDVILSYADTDLSFDCDRLFSGGGQLPRLRKPWSL